MGNHKRRVWILPEGHDNNASDKSSDACLRESSERSERVAKKMAGLLFTKIPPALFLAAYGIL